MAALDDDTRLEGSDGRYRAVLSEDWRIWGPNGGYLAALALRAAGAATDLTRPASIACHFLGVAEFAPVEIAVRTLRRTRRAESLSVDVTQAGAPVVHALVWATAGGDGLVHHTVRPPDVARPETLLPMEERLPDEQPLHPFWENLEVRPCDWLDDWDARPAGHTRERTWYRFRPRAPFADPFLDAARALLLLDTVGWPAAVRGHPGELDWYAPSLDVAARFHVRAPHDEWLLVDARSPVAEDGLVGATVAVWSASGRLVATGGQQMLCRPMHLNPAGPPPDAST